MKIDLAQLRQNFTSSQKFIRIDPLRLKTIELLLPPSVPAKTGQSSANTSTKIQNQSSQQNAKTSITPPPTANYTHTTASQINSYTTTQSSQAVNSGTTQANSDTPHRPTKRNSDDEIENLSKSSKKRVSAALSNEDYANLSTYEKHGMARLDCIITLLESKASKEDVKVLENKYGNILKELKNINGAGTSTSKQKLNVTILNDNDLSALENSLSNDSNYQGLVNFFHKKTSNDDLNAFVDQNCNHLFNNTLKKRYTWTGVGSHKNTDYVKVEGMTLLKALADAANKGRDESLKYTDHEIKKVVQKRILLINNAKDLRSKRKNAVDEPGRIVDDDFDN